MGNILSGGIKRENFVQILVVELFHHYLLDMSEINYHAVYVQFMRTAPDRDNPVVTVQIFTLAGIGKTKAVGCRHFHTFNYCVHRFNTLTKKWYY